jgi:hypothetical protein
MARYRIAGIARDNDNNPVVGGNASLRRESDNVEIAATTTGADGFYGWLETDVNYPGSVKVRITAPDGVVRETSGRATGQSGTFFIPDLMRAFRMMTDGVVDGVDSELLVSASGGSMDVSVAPGFAFLFGHPSYWPDTETVTIAANGTGNPRLDLIVLRFYPPGAANEGEQDIAVIQGTPAAVPAAPGVTQDPNVVWEIPLATVAVAAGAAAITGGNVTDARIFSSGPLMDSSVVSAKIADLAVLTGKLAAKAVTPAKMTAEAQVSTTAIAKVLKAATTVDTSPSYAQLVLSELADVSETTPTAAQSLRWNATDSKWEPYTPAALGLIIQEGDVTIVTSATVLDFTAAPFAVTESPTGEANIDIAALGIDTTRLADGSVTNVKVATAIDAVKLADGTVTNTEFQRINSVTSNVQDQLDGKASTTHVHETGPALMNKATKAYGFTGITSTSTTLGDLIIDCDITLVSGVTYDIFATGYAQANAPTGGNSIYVGIKIGAQNTEWGDSTQLTGGDRTIVATSTRTVTGPTTQTIALRGRITGGASASVTTGHVNVFAVPRTVPAS